MGECNIIILGKEGKELARVPSSFDTDNPKIHEIMDALSTADIYTELSENKNKKSIPFNVMLLDTKARIVGNYSSAWDLITGLNARGLHLAQETIDLVSTINSIYGQEITYLITENDQLVDANKKSVNGVVFSIDETSPVVVINGFDVNTIERTLIHELIHVAWNRKISENPSIRENIYQLHKELKTHRKTNSAIAYVLDEIDRGTFNAQEIFANIMSDYEVKNFVIKNYPNYISEAGLPLPEAKTNVSSAIVVTDDGLDNAQIEFNNIKKAVLDMLGYDEFDDRFVIHLNRKADLNAVLIINKDGSKISFNDDLGGWDYRYVDRDAILKEVRKIINNYDKKHKTTSSINFNPYNSRVSTREDRKDTFVYNHGDTVNVTIEGPVIKVQSEKESIFFNSETKSFYLDDPSNELKFSKENSKNMEIAILKIAEDWIEEHPDAVLPGKSTSTVPAVIPSTSYPINFNPYNSRESTREDKKYLIRTWYGNIVYVSIEGPSIQVVLERETILYDSEKKRFYYGDDPFSTALLEQTAKDTEIGILKIAEDWIKEHPSTEEEFDEFKYVDDDTSLIPKGSTASSDQGSFDPMKFITNTEHRNVDTEFAKIELIKAKKAAYSQVHSKATYNDAVDEAQKIIKEHKGIASIWYDDISYRINFVDGSSIEKINSSLFNAFNHDVGITSLAFLIILDNYKGDIDITPSFSIAQSTVSTDKLFPRMQRDEKGYGYSNIEEAIKYYEDREEETHRYWGINQPINSDFQARQIKAGDLIQMNLLQYLKKGESKRLGLANNDYPLSAHLDEIMTDFEANQKMSKADFKEKLIKLGYNSGVDVNKILAAQKEYLKDENNIKWRHAKKNYISTGVFYDKELGKWCTYVPFRFGKNVGSVRIAMNLDYVHHTRKLAEDFKTHYVYEKGKVKRDEDGNPVLKEVKSDIDTDHMSQNSINEARQSINEVALADVEKISKADEKDLDGPIAKEFKLSDWKSFLSNTKYGIKITGFTGDLEEHAMAASNGDIIRYIAGWDNKKPVYLYGAKVMNIAGGVIVIDSEGKMHDVGASAVQSVIYRKSLIKEKILQEAKKFDSVIDRKSNNYAKGEAYKEDSSISIYPFFADDVDRQKLASGLEKGDVVKVRYFNYKTKEYIEMFAPILYVTQTHIYYATQSEEYPIQSVLISETSKDKWIKQDGKWRFGSMENGKFVPSKDTKTVILAAYKENTNASLFNFVRNQIELYTNSFKNKTLVKDTSEMSLQDAADYLTGAKVKEGHTDEDGKIVLQFNKSSLDSEWSMTDVSKLSMADKVDALSDLVPGDIIKVAYTNKDGEQRTYWTVFKKYNKDTGEPMILGKYKGKVITHRTELEGIVAVGKRILPVVYYIDNEGDSQVHTANEVMIEKIRSEGEKVHVIAEGRPLIYNNLRERMVRFLTTDRHALILSEEDVKKHKERLQKTAGRFDDMDFVPCKAYVNDDGEMQYFLEPLEGFKLAKDQPVKYKVKMTKKNGKSYYLRNIDFDEKLNQLYYAGKKNFEEMSNILTPGDYVTMEVTIDNKKVMLDCVISNITGSYIEGSYFHHGKDGAFIPKQITWFKSYDNIRIVDAYVQNLSKVYEQKEKKTVKKSESMKAKKSFDSGEVISLLANKMSDLYGVNTTILNQQGMTDLGVENNCDFSKTRACVINGEIYINIDLASTADVLHEFTHLLLPGLKSSNIEAYNSIMSRLADNPMYEEVRKAYPELSESDLNEEAFCTIFGEYFRSKMVTKASENWVGEDLVELTKGVSTIVSDLFDVDASPLSAYELMNMSLEDIMMSLGSSLVTGDLKKGFNLSVMLNNDTYINKIYKSLIDSGHLIRMC